MKKHVGLVVIVMLMFVGFAAISTTLIINGNAKVSENTEDFSVIFTAATLDGTDVYANVISEDKKTITFQTNDLMSLNQSSVLNYEVTNNSSNYDAEVTVNCKVKDNATAKYTSIKNELEGNVTVIKAKETLNGTLTVTLNKTSTEEVREEYVCTLILNAIERNELGVAPINLYNMIKDNANTTTVIDYKVRSGVSGTNGIYTTTTTEGNVPVYYYRGNADKVNNNIIFNNMCWKIIRTTETGGVKLIYNGASSDGKCENQLSKYTQMGTSAFNENRDDNAYVGYMYGTPGSSTYEATHANTNNSTIKTYIDNWYSQNFDETATSKLEDTVFCNDRSTKAYNENTIDAPSSFYKNISSYGSLGYGKNATLYGAAHRSSELSKNLSPSLICQNKNDKFTVDSKNGNGALTNPVGLITTDEAILAGFCTTYGKGDDNYLSTEWLYWTLTPVATTTYGEVLIGYVSGSNDVHGIDIDIKDFSNVGVRPVVSLASGTLVTGSGTSTNPYVVE